VIIIAGGIYASISLPADRIVTPWMKRMAFYESKHRKVTPFEKPIAIECLFGITRASWVKSTVFPQQRTERKSIELYHTNCQSTHCYLPEIHSAAAVCTKIDATTSSSPEKTAGQRLFEPKTQYLEPLGSQTDETFRVQHVSHDCDRQQWEYFFYLTLTPAVIDQNYSVVLKGGVLDERL
jgi:hypothetical protein